MNIFRITISSFELSFFLKLGLCQGQKFAIPQHNISAMDVQANFDKALVLET